jgi:hypothetical protein
MSTCFHFSSPLHQLSYISCASLIKLCNREVRGWRVRAGMAAEPEARQLDLLRPISETMEAPMTSEYYSSYILLFSVGFFIVGIFF